MGNVRYEANKMYELSAPSRSHGNCSLKCFPETWPSSSSTVALDRFHIMCANGRASSEEKKRVDSLFLCTVDDKSLLKSRFVFCMY